MKTKAITFLLGVGLTVAVMAGLYTQIKPEPIQQPVAAKPQAVMEKSNAAANAGEDYSKLVEHLQQKDNQLLQTLEEKFASINENIEYFGNQVEGIAERVDQIESGQNNQHHNDGAAHTDKHDDSDSREQSKQNQALTQQTFQQNLNDTFAAEPIDDSWGIGAQQNVETLFIKQENPIYKTSHLKSIECRSASCRVEIAHDPEIEAEDFESEFLIDAAKAGFPRVRGHYSDNNGTKVGTYYLAQQTAKASSNDATHAHE